DDRASIQEEIDARVKEIDRIAASAAFNGTKLLDGTGTSLTIQVGANSTPAEDTIDITLTDATAATLGVDALTVTDNTAAQTTITAVDGALKAVDSARSGLGAIQNRFESTVANLNNTITNLSASRSRI